MTSPFLTVFADLVGPPVSAEWLNAVNQALYPESGNTATRPVLTSDQRGIMYFDTTLATAGKPIWWTGYHWVDATGTIV
jgi:hypothetical protein